MNNQLNIIDVFGEEVSSYDRANAIDDGYLVEILPHRWDQLTGGRPIVATRAIFENVSMAGIMEIYNEYVRKATTEEQRELFVTKMDGRKVWVMDDSNAITIMYPEDY